MDKMSALFDYRYFSKEYMRGLKYYKYSAVDTSPLAKYVMKPWWEFFVKSFMPLSISANTMTFGGFLIGLTHFILVNWYDPGMLCCRPGMAVVNTIPDWVWLYGAIAHFLAHTLDGADGIQARRTKTSSALGELMDHGLDSLSLSILLLTIPSVMLISGPGESIRTEWAYAAFAITMAGFYMTHWEKYVTGILFLPWTYDIAMLAMQLFFLKTFLVKDMVAVYLRTHFGLEFYAVVVSAMAGSVFVFSLPCTVWNIISAIRKSDDYVKKHATWNQAPRPLVPFAVMMFSFIALYWLTDGEALYSHPRLFLYSHGVIFSNLTARLIVAQMCRQTCAMANWMLLLPMWVMMAIASGWQSLDSAMWTMLVVLSLAHLHFGICLVRQFSHHLHVPCLAMKNTNA